MLGSYPWLKSVYLRLTTPAPRLRGRRENRRLSPAPCMVERLELRQLLSGSPVGAETLVNTTTNDPPFAITVPVADASYQLGQHVTVTWEGGDSAGLVDVELIETTLGLPAQVAAVVAAGVPNTGNFEYTLPTTHPLGGPDNHQYKFYVENVDRTSWAYGPVFNVTPIPFTITTPVADSTYQLGQHVTVAWDGGNPAGLVDVELIETTPGLPAQVAAVVAAGVPNSGRFDYTLPTTHPLGGPDNHQYKFYVENVDRTSWAYGPVFNVTPTPFTIITPVADATYQLGQHVTVTWDGGNPAGLVDVELIETTPGLPAQVAAVVAAGVPNSGNFEYTLPASHPLGGPDNHQYKFYVENVARTSWAYGPVFNVTPTPFTITAPVADVTYQLGQHVTITWDGGNPAGLVDVELIETTTGLPAQVAAVVASGVPNTGSFEYTLPITHPLGGPDNHQYKFYVENVARTSWAYGPVFNVTPTPFTITAPVADATYQLGQHVTITWEGGNPAGLVDVELIETTPGLPAQVAAVVASGVPNTGSFEYTLPASHPLGGPDDHQYKFYVENVARTSWAYGPVFNVTPTPFTIITPVADATYQLGQHVTVTWNGGNPTGLVDVELIETTPGLPAQVAAVVASGVPNTGSFEYTLPITHPLGGPDNHQYKFYVENVARTSWAYGPVFNVLSNTPVAVDDAFSTDEDTPLVLSQNDLKGNDTDVDTSNSQLTVTAVAGPTNGTVRLNGDGSITFSPTSNFYGLAGFDYLVSDGGRNDIGHVSITVNSINDAPTISVNNLTISESATVVLSSSNINATDPDNTATQLTYTASSVTGGTFQLVATSAVSTSFTQAQINAGAVKFVHNGGESAPSYSLSANDGAVSSGASTAAVTFTNVNDAPVISTNNLTISEGATVVLSSTNINSTDPDNTTAQLTYTTSSVTGGTFQLVATSAVITSFTQTQINAGAVKFVHNGGETAPSYSLSVNDGAVSSGASAAAVTFTNVNDAPVISTNNLTISEGATVVLTSSNINSTDPDNTTAQLTYTTSSVTGGTFQLVATSAVITSFTQAQINAGAVKFVHNGGESAPSYSLSVNDGAVSSGASAAAVTFTNVNDAPVISTNNLTISEGATVVLSSTNINATDPDNSTAQLTYTTSSVTGGTFQLVATSAVITSFTQAQINAGAVKFVHNGGETAPSYSLSVSDGALSSGASAVAVTFTNVNDAPVISTNSLTISEGATVVLTSSNINSTDPDNTTAQLTYTVGSVTGGTFQLVATSAVITSFSQAQINAGAVKFVHDGSQLAPSYTLTVSDGLTPSAASNAAITFTLLTQGVYLINGTLYIIGTEGRDHVELQFNDKKNELKVNIQLNQGGCDSGNDHIQQTLTGSAIHRIVTILGGGDDEFNGGNDGGSDASMPSGFGSTATQFVFGGAGNDQIQGGRGRSVLVGGAGNDELQGKSGLDILIGGIGKDILKAGKGNDLLIGGSASNENDLALLDAAINAWSLGQSALGQSKVGLVTDDYETDVLQGQQGVDVLVGGVGDKLKQ